MHFRWEKLMIRRRSLLFAAMTLAVTALVVIGGLFVFRDQAAGPVRHLIVRQLEAITDRNVSIGGDFDLVPSLAPTLAVAQSDHRIVRRGDRRRLRGRPAAGPGEA